MEHGPVSCSRVEYKVTGESAGDSDAGAPCEGDLTDRRHPAALVIFFPIT
jgi:hypothetical protein